jgi:hypothetical protein
MVNGHCQTAQPSEVQEQVSRLNDAVNRVQAQIDDSQRELAELRQQLAALQGSVNAPAAVTQEKSPASDAADLTAAVAGLRETQSIHTTQIGILEQTKVESESKFPLKMTGLVLMTGIVSTQGTDAAQTPTVAMHGSGSTAATVRQTTLGLDARGPHLFGAVSHADLRFDFDGSTDGTAYNANGTIGLLRMRTAHADLDWQHSQAFFALDRPLLSPDTPTSLIAVAIPALGWSGNLWTWNPQIGASHDFFDSGPASLRVQTALIDVADPPAYSSAQTPGYSPPGSAEQSRWPGIESRLAIENAGREGGAHFGISGYFAPHRIPQPRRFNSWAGAVDFNLPATGHMQFTGSAYRGQALGGLGAGAFKDYAASIYYGESYFRALDDMGGWLQWKQRGGTRIEFNEAFGMDNVPAHQLRPFATTNFENYLNLARNRTLTGNVIYSPSAYLLFSLEYRRIASSFVNSPTEFSDIIGLAAGYRF